MNLDIFNHVKKNDIEKVKEYISQKKDLEVKREDLTLLSYSLMLDKFEISKLLIESGSDLNVFDNDGYSPLLWALNFRDDFRDVSEDNRFALTKLLLENGSDPNSITKDEKHTPLTYETAIKCNHDIIYLLLRHGSLVDFRPKHGKSFLYYLKEEGINLDIEWLFKHSTYLYPETKNVLKTLRLPELFS